MDMLHQFFDNINTLLDGARSVPNINIRPSAMAFRISSTDTLTSSSSVPCRTNGIPYLALTNLDALASPIQAGCVYV